MVQKKFGSTDSTGRKLDVIEEYLSMYQRALSKTGLATIYIDGFAGSGEVLPEDRNQELSEEPDLLDNDVRTVLAGSAERAVNVRPQFDRYVFIDQRRKCVEALKRRLVGKLPADRSNYEIGDANAKIKEICLGERWRFQRGIVLLDPFGNQVEWSTVEAIAETEAIDLWYLFPAGLGVFRQISNIGTVGPFSEASITKMFGTDDWKSAFLRPSVQEDLFARQPRHEKVVTPESAAEFMIGRLKSVFKGSVLDEMIPLGKHAYASFYLLFASGNPSPPARELAKTLSKAALKATDRKNGRLI